MNHLDNFYKDKLNEREFEFDESLWLQAEELISANEEKKKRRAFVWWFLGGILMVSLIGGVALWNIDDSNSDNIIQTEIQTNSKINNTQIQDAETKEDNFNSNNSKPTAQLKKPQGEIKSEIKTPNSSIVFKAVEEVKNQKSESTTSNKLFDKGIKKEAVISTSKSNPNQPSIPKIENPRKTTNSSADDEIPTRTAENIAQISLLKLNPFFIQNSSEIRSFTNFEPEESRKIHFGLVGSFIFLPNSKFNQDVSYKGGLSIGIPLNGGWELGTELSYYLFNNEFESLGESPQATFGLGGNFDNYKLNPNQLHFLNLPIYAKYKFGFHALEGGIAFDYLLGARGELILEDHLQSWERDDIQNQKYTQEIALAAAVIGTSESLNEINYREPGVIRKGWLDDSNLNKIQTHFLLGYQYRFNKKTNLGIRAQYRVTDFRKSNLHLGTNPPIRNFVKNDSKWSIHLSMNYRIF